jgi:hypothetical protein
MYPQKAVGLRKPGIIRSRPEDGKPVHRANTERGQFISRKVYFAPTEPQNHVCLSSCPPWFPVVPRSSLFHASLSILHVFSVPVIDRLFDAPAVAMFEPGFSE